MMQTLLISELLTGNVRDPLKFCESDVRCRGGGASLALPCLYIRGTSFNVPFNLRVTSYVEVVVLAMPCLYVGRVHCSASAGCCCCQKILIMQTLKPGSDVIAYTWDRFTALPPPAAATPVTYLTYANSKTRQ